MRAYNEKLAEFKFAEKFLSQFDVSNIETSINDINKQLARMGEI